MRTHLREFLWCLLDFVGTAILMAVFLLVYLAAALFIRWILPTP